MSSTPDQQAGACRGDQEPMKVEFKNTFIHVKPDSSEDILNRRSGRNKTEPARLPAYADEDSQDEGTDDGINVDVGMHKKGASAPGPALDLVEQTPDHTTRLAMQAHIDGTSPFHTEVVLPAQPEQPAGAIRGVASEGLPVRMPPARRQVMVTFPLDVPEGLEDYQSLAATVMSVQKTVIAPNGCAVIDLQVLVGNPSAISSQPVCPQASVPFPKGSISSAPVQLLSLRPAEINGTVSAPLKSEAKNVTVCCHWKNKGWCKLEDGCKFMHPPAKKGVGSTRRKGGEVASAEARKATNSTNLQRLA